MDKQKQIEEMAKVLVVKCGECNTCKYLDELHCADLLSAEELYNAGYRKESETAEKFAERLKEKLDVNLCLFGERVVFDGEIDEIAKEITGGEKEISNETV